MRLFSELHQYHGLILLEVGGWEVGVGGGWETKGGLNHPLAQEKSRCVFNKAQKQPQCTCQDKTVAGSSLTPHADLLVHPSGTIYTP